MASVIARRSSGSSAGGDAEGRPPSRRRSRIATPRELWGRRSVAIGVLLVGIALAGGLALLIAGGGDGSSDSAAKTSSQVAELQDRFLKQTVVEVDKGISVRRPADWSQTRSHGVITLRSRDRCLAMTLSAPQPSSQATKVRSDSADLFKRTYRNAKVQPARSAQVGGIPTTSDTIRFTDGKGKSLQVLLSVGTGERYAYLTEIVVRSPSCQGDLQLAQVTLSSIQYTK